MSVMKISIGDSPKPETVKVRNMPKGSIGRVTGSIQLYAIRTNENGDHFILLWPDAEKPAIEGISKNQLDHYGLNWDVELLPAGTKVTFEF